MKNSLLLFIPILAMTISGCSKKNNIQNDTQVAIADPVASSDLQHKNVLIEMITSVYCSGCPTAHEQAADIAKAHPGHVFEVGIFTNLSGGTWPGWPDFTTSQGEQIIREFSNESSLGIPIGDVNRRIYTDIAPKYAFSPLLLDIFTWGQASEEVLAETAPVNIALTSGKDPSSGLITVKAQTYYTTAETDSNYIYIMLTEDGIVSEQEVFGGINQNYVENNMLRKVITNIYGDRINKTLKGSRQAFSYSFSASSKFNLNNCNLVAFVTNHQFEILNATKIKVIQ